MVDELIEGLVLLREQCNRAACYWLCPVCEQKFHTSRDFLGHVELVHEGLAVQDNKYVACSKCQQDVVGMYYSSNGGSAAGSGSGATRAAGGSTSGGAVPAAAAAAPGGVGGYNLCFRCYAADGRSARCVGGFCLVGPAPQGRGLVEHGLPAAGLGVPVPVSLCRPLRAVLPAC